MDGGHLLIAGWAGWLALSFLFLRQGICNGNGHLGDEPYGNWEFETVKGDLDSLYHTRYWHM